MKITRFIDYNGAKSFLSENSTFKLASCRHYQILEEIEKDLIWGDKCESRVGRSEFEAKSSLISCWTICENGCLDWKIFPERTKGIAVVSTVEKVSKFLDLARVSAGLGEKNFKHMPVKYYDQNDPKKPEGFDIFEAMFWKRQSYGYQNEYRFAFLGGVEAISSIVYYPDRAAVLEMIDEIHLGVDIAPTELEKLYIGAIQLSANGGPNALSKVCDLDLVINRIQKAGNK